MFKKRRAAGTLTFSCAIATLFSVLAQPAHALSKAPHDFNGDGKSDLLWTQSSSGATVMWLMNGAAPPARLAAANLGGSLDWSVTQVGDFNGDGSADLVWRQASTGATVLWFMQGTTRQSAAFIGGSTDWSVSGTGDYNGDGKTDLLWRQASTGATVVHLMNGAAVITSASLGGSTLVAQSGIYGSRGTPAPANVPGARNWDAGWQDAGGNFWVFGGQGFDSTGAASGLNDLWRYNPSSGLWTWEWGSNTVNAIGVYAVRGAAAAANAPGARENMAYWSDASGNLWLFGGYGSDGTGTLGYLSDLWEYSPTTGQWTWVGGPSTTNSAGTFGTLGTESAGNWPSARYGAVSWKDSAGNIWLFGGYGVDSAGSTAAYLNDLWKLDVGNGRWTWMSGSKVSGAAGVYGNKGVEAAGNVPGARGGGQTWTDGKGNFWLFGGYGVDSLGAVDYINDLWKYNVATGRWTWANGSNVAGALGVYGTRGSPATGNTPGARGGSVGWLDAGGDLWLFGGFGYDSVKGSDDLNDTWRYNVAAGTWTWVNGSNLTAAAGQYGALRVPSTATQPGARDSGVAWSDSRGHVWLFGGAGYDSAGTYNTYGLNDVFEFIP